MSPPNPTATTVLPSNVPTAVSSVLTLPPGGGVAGVKSFHTRYDVLDVDLYTLVMYGVVNAIPTAYELPLLPTAEPYSFAGNTFVMLLNETPPSLDTYTFPASDTAKRYVTPVDCCV